MQHSRADFEARLRTLGRKHKAIAQGAHPHMRGDGLVVMKPRRRASKAPLLLKVVLFLVVSTFMIKAFMLYGIGATEYKERLAYLEQGAQFERIGAVIMQVDPVTSAVADTIDRLVDNAS